jgi:dipeptidyl aminopeptidase/acylaminoacyl peptidase
MPESSRPALVPREVLFGNPIKSSPHISPDAQHLAFLAPLNGVLNVWAGNAGDDPDTFGAITNDTVRGIRSYFWAQDSHTILYVQDVGGNENWRIYAVDIESRDVRDMTPFDDVQARIIGTHKDHPDEILVALNRENPQLHDAYHLRLSTGELTRIAKNPGNVTGWIIDADFQLRGATAMLPDGSSQLLLRDPAAGETAEWRLFKAWALDDALTSRPAGFTQDARAIYLVDSTGVNAGRLTLVDIESGHSTVVVEDPQYDVGGVVLHPDTRVLQAVIITRDRTSWQFFDPEFEKDFNRLTDIHPGEISVVGRDREDKVWLVSFYNDINTTHSYLYDRQSREARFLFASQPELDSYSLSPMQPIEIPARDGLTLRGYLSLPVGREPTSLPLILNVHGGPWGRDTWGMNPEAQWFSNRGYATLQINFRGSTGYGKNFLNAGNREWGAAMHDDLVDSVEWAVAKGIADPKRVAIYGGSYGGYAALVGATFTPDLFCCAVDIVGPSNLASLISTIPPYWHAMKSLFYLRVGDPDTEAEFLASRSPLTYVDRIKIPILIAQGANDPRVKQAESDQIVEAMRAKGIPYEYMVFEDEGHGFARPENRLKFYAAAERFLAKHLGGRFEE